MIIECRFFFITLAIQCRNQLFQVAYHFKNICFQTIRLRPTWNYEPVFCAGLLLFCRRLAHSLMKKLLK